MGCGDLPNALQLEPSVIASAPWGGNLQKLLSWDHQVPADSGVMGETSGFIQQACCAKSLWPAASKASQQVPVMGPCNLCKSQGKSALHTTNPHPCGLN